MRSLGVVSLLVAFAVAQRAQAYDVAANVGVISVLSLPHGERLGTYPYAAASMAFPVKRATLIPSLGLEWAPGINRWGFVTGLTTDFPVADTLGLDIIVTFIHDQDRGNFRGAIFLLGAGLGFSASIQKWTLSPSLNFFGGLNFSGWAVVPGFNVAYTF